MNEPIFKLWQQLQRHRIWIIQLLLLAVIGTGILWVDKRISNHLNPHFNCEATLIDPSLPDPHSAEKKLRLRIFSQGNRALIRVGYHHIEQSWVDIELSGTLKGVEAGSMSYLINLDKHQEWLHVAEDELPSYLLGMKRQIKKSLEQSASLDIKLHVLEMDVLSDYALLRVTPGDHLWACRMRETSFNEAETPLNTWFSGLMD